MRSTASERQAHTSQVTLRRAADRCVRNGRKVPGQRTTVARCADPAPSWWCVSHDKAGARFCHYEPGRLVISPAVVCCCARPGTPVTLVALQAISDSIRYDDLRRLARLRSGTPTGPLRHEADECAAARTWIFRSGIPKAGFFTFQLARSAKSVYQLTADFFNRGANFWHFPRRGLRCASRPRSG